MRLGPEDREQLTLVNYIRLNNLAHWHPIQENVIKQPGYWSKMKMMGWNKGLSDMIVYIPSERCKSKSGALVFIELKKRRTLKKSGEFKKISSDGISVSEEQIEFIESVNTVTGCQGAICYGSDEAISFIEQFLI